MILKLIGHGDNSGHISYFDADNIHMTPRGDCFELYNDGKLSETVGFTSFENHSVVAYIMEKGQTVDKFISKPAAKVEGGKDIDLDVIKHDALRRLLVTSVKCTGPRGKEISTYPTFHMDVNAVGPGGVRATIHPDGQEWNTLELMVDFREILSPENEAWRHARSTARTNN